MMRKRHYGIVKSLLKVWLAAAVLCVAVSRAPAQDDEAPPAESTIPETTPTPEPELPPQARQPRDTTRERRPRQINPFDLEALSPFGQRSGGGSSTRSTAPRRARPQARSRIATSRSGQYFFNRGDVGLPDYTLPQVILTNTLYFEPSETTVGVGDRFTTTLMYYNANENRIDSLDIWIRYAPELLQPTSISTQPVEDRLRGAMKREVWRDRGFVHIQADFDPPLNRQIQPIVLLTWKAGETATEETLVSLEAPHGAEIGMYEEGKNVLGREAIRNRGRVSMSVAIDDEGMSEELRPGMRMLERGEDPYLPVHRVRQGVRLGLIPESRQVLPGEVSTIDVVLINPDVVAFDELRFRIRYDPEAVEILDADEDNYITTGVNIYDGGFQERMPFEAYLQNRVNPDRGVIDYVVRSQQGLKPYPSGTVARIVYRMKRRAGYTTFWFEGLNPMTGEYYSDVRARGRSLLGPPDGRPMDGLHNAKISVAPM